MPQKPAEQPAPESKEPADGTSKVTEAIRPLAKEIIKGGLMTYAALTDSLSGIGKQVSELVDEAKSELSKKEPPPKKKSPDDSSPK
ncbi:MAG: hypothetical protein R3351_01725 [Nitrospirales bacterium]|nr:hypothetical protein [Nitrospirales bacterium]